MYRCYWWCERAVAGRSTPWRPPRWRRALQTSSVSLGLVGPTAWLSARWWNDLSVLKLVEEELICMMELCQCQWWSDELACIVYTECGPQLTETGTRTFTDRIKSDKLLRTVWVVVTDRRRTLRTLPLQRTPSTAATPDPAAWTNLDRTTSSSLAQGWVLSAGSGSIMHTENTKETHVTLTFLTYDLEIQ